MARIKIKDLPTGKKLDRKMMKCITGGVICLPEDAGGFKAGVVCLPEEGGGSGGSTYFKAGVICLPEDAGGFK